MMAAILKGFRKICCAATCHDLNAAYKLLLIYIKLAFVCETKRHIFDALGAVVVTTGGEMQGSIQLDSGVMTVSNTGTGFCCA
jgi:hypothetical protein